MTVRIVPETVAEDDDDVVIALETARVSEERSDVDAAIKWLQRAAAAARKQGRPERAGTLSRAAAGLGGVSSQFERREEEPQVLGEITEDDFSEKTIVESAAEIAAKTAPEAAVSAKHSQDSVEMLVDKPTPIAPLLAQSKAQSHSALRVAVKKVLGGRYEARPLASGEALLPGEQEALLVPVQGDTKL